MSGLVTIHPDRKTDRFMRRAARSPVRGLFVCAAGYAVCQPVLIWLNQAMFGHRDVLQSVAAWTRFEVCVAGLGVLAGCAWFYSLRWRPGTWLSDWAEWGVPGIAASGLFSRLEVFAPSHGWLAAALSVGIALPAAAITGAVFASLTQGVRRIARAATPPPRGAVRTKPVP